MPTRLCGRHDPTFPSSYPHSPTSPHPHPDIHIPTSSHPDIPHPHILTSSHPHISSRPHSHSIVDGGLELMSNTTRFTPRTSFTMREEIRARSSCGSLAQSAVIPSRLSTARIATVCS